MADKDGHEAAARFVAAAEAATNRYDATAAASLYAEGAVLEVVPDGALERFEGEAAITAAWHSYMTALHSSGFRLRKRVICASTALNASSPSLAAPTSSPSAS